MSWFTTPADYLMSFCTLREAPKRAIMLIHFVPHPGIVNSITGNGRVSNGDLTTSVFMCRYDPGMINLSLGFDGGIGRRFVPYTEYVRRIVFDCHLRLHRLKDHAERRC
jgi:hypothetical protein